MPNILEITNTRPNMGDFIRVKGNNTPTNLWSAHVLWNNNELWLWGKDPGSYPQFGEMENYKPNVMEIVQRKATIGEVVDSKPNIMEVISFN